LTRLVAYASRGHIPLPLAGIDNRRSFINLPNLLDFLWRVATRAQADGQILLCSDREDVSCATLLTAMGEAHGAPIHLFAAPRLLETACRLLGQDARHASLTGNFQIDPSRSCDRLAWQPRTSLAKGLREMVTSSPT
jgi:nucleoside-diphosphate-sugar epimerase